MSINSQANPGAKNWRMSQDSKHWEHKQVSISQSSHWFTYLHSTFSKRAFLAVPWILRFGFLQVSILSKRILPRTRPIWSKCGFRQIWCAFRSLFTYASQFGTSWVLYGRPISPMREVVIEKPLVNHNTFSAKQKLETLYMQQPTTPQEIDKNTPFFSLNRDCCCIRQWR